MGRAKRVRVAVNLTVNAHTHTHVRPFTDVYMCAHKWITVAKNGDLSKLSADTLSTKWIKIKTEMPAAGVHGHTTFD